MGSNFKNKLLKRKEGNSVKKLKGISFFEDLLEKPQNELVDKAIAAGRTAIGYNCYVVPEALISAGNVFPLWMRAPGVESTSEADYFLSSVVCSYSKAILQSGLDGTYDFLGALVFAPSCDHIRRSGQHYELQGVNKSNEKFFLHMLDTSYKVNDSGIKWFVQDMKKLVVKLNEAYDANINEDTLKKAIKDLNEFNRLMQSIGDFRKGPNPKITGTEFHKVYGASKVAPKDMLIEPLKKLKAELEARESVAGDNIRVMVVGPVFDNPKFVELIEAQGALVVADRYCFGSLPGMEPIEEEGDPYVNLATYQLGTCQCSRMMEKSVDRIDYSKKLVKEYSVEGIIFETMQFCDLWGYEGLNYIDGMKESNVPVVKIVREYSLTGEGQFRTRIQAFLESIKSKKD
jgi:benzoyl-CoA reductase/2-hydroxyglutaryl-CoA dehydratase subunit BcrC/BadD/HgdB